MVNTTLTITRPALRWLAGGLAVGLLATTLVGPAVGAVQAQSDTEETLRTISVDGTGRVKTEPDVADITIGVTQQGEDAKEASSKAAESMDAVIAALLELGIDEKDIQTTSLNLNPLYDWDDNPPEIEGWEASNLVNVTVRNIDAVGDVVDATTAAGATNINSISFRVEDPTEAEAEAREAAVKDAQAKADQLASAAMVNIIAVVSISESGAQPPQPIYLARAEMAAADTGASTPVMPGEVELTVNVNIQYEIE